MVDISWLRRRWCCHRTIGRSRYGSRCAPSADESRYQPTAERRPDDDPDCKVFIKLSQNAVEMQLRGKRKIWLAEKRLQSIAVTHPIKSIRRWWYYVKKGWKFGALFTLKNTKKFEPVFVILPKQCLKFEIERECKEERQFVTFVKFKAQKQELRFLI